MTSDVWAKENRVYPKSAAIPGPRDPWLTPYIVPIERAIDARSHRRVVAVFGTQMSKTELAMDCIGNRLDTSPVPIAIVAPSEKFLREEISPRIEALIQGSRSLRSKQPPKRQPKANRTIAGVTLRLLHAGSATALAGGSFGMVISDEVDKLMANVKGQGDPISLADRRGDAYGADFVHFATSSPTVGDVEVVRSDDPESFLEFWDERDPRELKSTIWQMWQSGTRYHWAVPCPDCNSYFVPRFRRLIWKKPVDKEGNELPSTAVMASRTAHMICEDCGGTITDTSLEWMNENGRFVAPGQTIDRSGRVHGPAPEAWTESFWVSGLCSPFVPWGHRAAEYVEAKRSGKIESVQGSVNGMGELWAPDDGEAPDWQELQALQLQDQEPRSIPDWVAVLTMAVDVQKDRLVFTIRGWGEEATSTLIEAGEIYGPPAEMDVWNTFAGMVTKTYDGLPIKLALIDSGYRPESAGKIPTHMVYRFCRRFPKLCKATKGASNPMRKPILQNKIDINIDGREIKKGLTLTTLDTSFFKRWLFQKFRWPETALGAWYVHKDISSDYLRQMVSEVEVTLSNGRTKWVQKSKENHFFDCEAMHGAAAIMLNLTKLQDPRRRRRPQPAPKTEPKQDPFDYDTVGVEARSPAAVSRPLAPKKKGGWLGKRKSIW